MKRRTKKEKITVVKFGKKYKFKSFEQAIAFMLA
jgi:pterin-4a-carbinolamine dehydratase